MQYIQKTVSPVGNSSMSRYNYSREKKNPALMMQYCALLYLLYIIHTCILGIIISEETASDTEDTKFQIFRHFEECMF